MSEVCIVAARRTPFGRFLGSLGRLSAVDLAVHAAEAAMERLPRDLVDLVIVGNVLSAGQGMNVARQVGQRLGLPDATPAFTVNMMCGSGLQALRLAAQAIRLGEADVVLCGGTESMSTAPHILSRSRTGTNFGDGQLVDTLLRDGLVDSITGEPMAVTAERLATQFGISRAEQDHFAALSQARCRAGVAQGIFDAELAPVAAPPASLSHDEHPRPETTFERLSALKPAFAADGTLTAGNASGMNDGAAMLLVASRAAAASHGWPVLAVVTGSTAVGCDPRTMGLGPVHALQHFEKQHACSLADFDAIEINEAFAAQTLACLRALDLDSQRVNRHGGAIALGHPLATSGARLAVHLAQQIARGAITSGIASLCVGGGMGLAVGLRKLQTED